ncbi:MAG: hypothetical protein KBD47_02540, partial [Candidatus Pacebacteria bacterium]|nr:hypothetical protein [Candidatus Paceibacterota bacterium]
LLTLYIKYVSVLQRAKKAWIIVIMKKFIPGIIFLVAFGAFVALLVTKKINRNNINNSSVTESTAAANTTGDVTVIIPIDSTTVSFRHE